MKSAKAKQTPVRAQLRQVDLAAVTVVLIRDLHVETLIGVHASERERPQTLVMDLEIELKSQRAADSDQLSDTIDYAAVVEDLRAQLAEQNFVLLERLARFVAERIIHRFGARRVVVDVAKAGILPRVGSVGVRMEWVARSRPAPALGFFSVPGSGSRIS